MRTLQEKYNGVINENFSKKQFVRDARLELPNLITQFNGFEDTVTILKNRGMIQEAKKQEVPEYDKPAPGYSIEALERAVDYELEGMGLMSQETVSEEDYAKAKQKAEKNLEKDPNHYLHLLSGDSKKVDKHDKYVEVKKNNHVDTFNGLKKAELKEGVQSLKEEIVDVIGLIKSKYPEVSNNDIKDFIKMHFADIQAGADPMEEFEQFLSVNPEILNVDEKKGKDLDGDGDIDSDDYMAAKDAAIKKAMGKPVKESENQFKVGDVVSVFMRGTKANGPEKATITAMDPSGVAIVKNAEGLEDEVFTKDMKSVHEASPTGFGTGQGRSKTISKGREERPDLKAAQAAAVKTAPKFVMKNGVPHKMKDGKLVPLTKINERVGGLQEFISLIQDRAAENGTTEAEEAEEVMYALGDHYNLGVDILHGPVNEGRRRKMKGGKVVTENDYETGGYVESMGPMLEKAMKQLEAVWEEWKAGPATEAAMVPHAKKDLVSYLESRITVGEDIVDEVSEEHQELKEAFKAIISRVLTEEVITEAATGNLSNIASKYDDYEGMQAAINTLENIVTDVESYYAKTKEKIQKVYDSFKDIRNAEGLAVGALIGPAIEDAFRKDLMPVTEKGFTKGLEMPKVKMLTPDDIQEEELEEKETVFKPVTEGKKYKYTKRQK